MGEATVFKFFYFTAIMFETQETVYPITFHGPFDETKSQKSRKICIWPAKERTSLENNEFYVKAGISEKTRLQVYEVLENGAGITEWEIIVVNVEGQPRQKAVHSPSENRTSDAKIEDCEKSV